MRREGLTSLAGYNIYSCIFHARKENRSKNTQKVNDIVPETVPSIYIIMHPINHVNKIPFLRGIVGVS